MLFWNWGQLTAARIASTDSQTAMLMKVVLPPMPWCSWVET